ncbi:MAG: hypothetical protein P8J59_12560 [Phycisphaerales bacterium]|jgi:hypothetical protein|nr:hypothetical protein [Phycisphaerales bacterium]
MKLIRFSLAPVAGIVAFMFGVMALEAVGHVIYPPPAEIEAFSREMGDAMATGDSARYRQVQEEMTPVLSAWLTDAPIGALLAVVLAWIGGGLIGGLVAALIAPSGKVWFALLVGAFDVVAIVMVTGQFSHPIWMPVLGIGGTLVVTGGVGWLMKRGPGKPSPV